MQPHGGGTDAQKGFQPHLNEYWCIPSKQNAEFFAYMEDVLEVNGNRFTYFGRWSVSMRRQRA